MIIFSKKDHITHFCFNVAAAHILVHKKSLHLLLPICKSGDLQHLRHEEMCRLFKHHISGILRTSAGPSALAGRHVLHGRHQFSYWQSLSSTNNMFIFKKAVASTPNCKDTFQLHLLPSTQIETPLLRPPLADQLQLYRKRWTSEVPSIPFLLWMYITVTLDFIVYYVQQNLMRKRNHWSLQSW